MQKTSLKIVADFQAPSDVFVSLSEDGRWCAYGDGATTYIGTWNNRAPHLTNIKEGPKVVDLRVLEWSPDSKYLLAASDKIVYLVEPDLPTKATVFRELEDLEIETIFWSYDSLFAIAVDCWGVATVVFEVRGGVHWLPGVRKADKKPLCALSPDCQMLVMCTYQSQVGVCLMAFSCEEWNLIWRVQSNCIFVSGISWFPDSSAVFVWDSIARFCIDFFHPDGSSKHSLTPAQVTDDGIRVASTSPCNSFLAIFDDDFQVHLYNTLIWRLVDLFDLRKLVNNEDDLLSWTPFLSWSTCGQYLACAASISTHLIIWSKMQENFVNFKISESSITDIAWHREKPLLVVATGYHQLYLLKCPGKENNPLDIDFCKIKSTLHVKEPRWVGANPSCLVVRESKNRVAVTRIRHG